MVEAATQPEFKPFPEIENHYQEVTKKQVAEHCKGELWVATEKIHGTNFCFVYDGKSVRHGKRTSMLTPTDKFYNFQQTISKRNDAKLPKIFDKLKTSIPTLSKITVFGEFYGGVYPNMQSKGQPIQKGLYYAPEVEFEAFDLFFETDDGKSHILNYKEAVKLFHEFDVPCAEILAEGTCQELLTKLDPEKFESTIYLKHKLEKVPDNFAEGYVLKPVDAMFIDGERFCIKFKNSRSLEVLAAAAPKPAAPEKGAKKEISAEDQAIVDKVLSYVSKQRLQNIASKLTEDERNEKKVVGLMIPDVFKDFGKGETKEVVEKANKLKSVITPLIKDETTKLFVAEYPQTAEKKE